MSAQILEERMSQIRSEMKKNDMSSKTRSGNRMRHETDDKPDIERFWTEITWHNHSDWTDGF